MIIDTHAHLYYSNLLKALYDILSRANDTGIEKIIIPAVDLESSLTVLKLTEKYEMLYAAIGIHPCDVGKCDIKMIDNIYKLYDNEKVVAVGETGLDYYWDTSNTEKQKDFFSKQIEIAIDKDLPVVIHTRDSLDDAVSIVKEKYTSGLKGQFHCFSGTPGQLNHILSLNSFYVSFCGNVTYKNFDSIEAVKEIPVGRLLSETDSPFLPPVPYRGKRNEPSYIVNTMEKIAELKEITSGTLNEAVYKNAKELFF
jgi:TatD DNase family protein